MRKSGISLVLQSTVALAAMLMASQAAAETAAAPADDSAAVDAGGVIMVTARKRQESLQDVPIAISAISAEKIERQGINSVQGIIKQQPSLQFDKGFSPQDNRISIRGLPGNSGRPAVAILIDGIDYTTESLATSGGGNLMDLRLFDFERIEVVKGPQSALYGRSAFGGAINYVPKEPGDEFGGSAGGELGLYGRAEAKAALNLPINETLAMRVNGVYTRDGGYYRNSVTGNKLGGYEAWGGSVAVKWQPNDAGKVIARLTYSNDHEEQRAAKYYGLANGLSTQLATPADVVGQKIGTSTIPASVYGYRKGYVENEDVPIAFSADPSDPTGKSDYPGARTKNLFASIHGEYDLGFADLSTWTGYTRSTGTTKADVDYFGRALTQVSYPAPGGLGEYSSDGHNGFWQFDISTKTAQINQEVRLSSMDGGPLRWAVGGLYWWEKVEQLDRRIVSYGLGINASAWLNLAQQGGSSPIADTVGRTSEHISGYGLVEYDILPTLTASVEGRYAKESYDYLFGRSVAIGSGDFTQGTLPIVFGGSRGTASASTTYFAPRGILSWKPSRDMMFYASAGRGVKPGGISQAGTVDIDLGTYKPERVSNYEVGAKFTFLNGRGYLNLAGFHMDYSNKQASTLVPVDTSISSQGALSVTTNAGKATIDGLEAEFGIEPVHGLTISGGYTYLDAQYKDFVYNTTSTFDPARTGTCTIMTVGSTQVCQIDLSGNGIEGASKHSGNITANYSMEVSDTAKAFVEATTTYRGKRWSDPYNAWKLHSYALVDVKAGITSDTYNVTFYVDNVFDNRTIQSAMSLLDVAAGSFGPLNMVAYMPEPRRAGVRFSYNF
ncbi:TonB-dependent receptor [Novosphingobium resinovorum]|uniref:TonB-dependent receptor n=1 Tax=Novosphingobium resinovorum TaxID=158500 RepID=UPI002ED6B627|nr:TonB-dependent receptor [Novosphingobium resinovorum]